MPIAAVHQSDTQDLQTPKNGVRVTSCDLGIAQNFFDFLQMFIINDSSDGRKAASLDS